MRQLMPSSSGVHDRYMILLRFKILNLALTRTLAFLNFCLQHHHLETSGRKRKKSPPVLYRTPKGSFPTWLGCAIQWRNAVATSASTAILVATK